MGYGKGGFYWEMSWTGTGELLRRDISKDETT
jgi:hypothetical protein